MNAWLKRYGVSCDAGRGLLATMLSLLAVCSANAQQAAGGKPSYPATKVEVVKDVLHGETVEDPYRWLENSDDPAVAAWTQQQNDLTRSILDRPKALRGKLAAKLGEIHAMPVVTVPRLCGDKFIFTRRGGDENHAIVLVGDDANIATAVEALNPNQFSPDGTVAMDWMFPSPDGSLIAYGKSAGGDEKSTLYLRDVKGRRDTMFTIPNTRAAAVAWDSDGAGFLYTRYPAAGTVPAGEENYHRHVYYHKFGTEVKDDARVFGEGAPKERWHAVYNSSSFRHQFLTASDDWAKNDLYVRAATPGTEFKPVARGLDGRFTGDVHVGKLYLLTNLDAPRYRVMVTDLEKPERENWKELIPQQDDIIEGMSIIGGRLVLTMLHEAHSRLAVFDTDGKHVEDVPLPSIGTVTGVSGKPDGHDVYFSFESLAVPPSVHKYSLKEKKLAPIFKPKASFDPAAYVTEMLPGVKTGDGQMLPVFIVRRAETKADGKRPTLLYGYGGFNVNVTPRFTAAVFPWLDAGGVYATASLRGGGEFGRAWHDGGRRDKKQNTFDDMAAACDALASAKWCTPETLVLRGGSNGGLLIGAMLTQHPGKFRAALCAVPLLDMLRYQNFRIARLWIPEYGSAEDATQYGWLKAYSPYQHVKNGTKYPAVLITTAEGDSRVDPMHARKMAARLQAATGGDAPILLWTEKKAGHGAGKPLKMRIEEQVDYLSFYWMMLGMDEKSEFPPGRE